MEFLSSNGKIEYKKSSFNANKQYKSKFGCCEPGRWNVVSHFTDWYFRLPVAIKAFLNSVSDSVPDLSTSVRQKMSWIRRRWFPLVQWRIFFFLNIKSGRNSESQATCFLFFTLNVVTFFQRERNSSPFSLPVTDDCQLVKVEIPCTVCPVKSKAMAALILCATVL